MYKRQELIWFGNGEQTTIDDSNRQVVASLPKLIGFSDTDLLKKVSVALNEIDDSILQQISTISVYPCLLYTSRCV